MTWNALIGSAAVAALVSGLIAVIGMFVNRATMIRVNTEKLKADQQLVERRFEFDKKLAEGKFAAERAQVGHKRRFDLAESLLSDAYRFRDLIGFARNGASFGNEGESRCENPELEPNDIERLKNMYFVPVERIQKETMFLSALMAKEHTARAYFGDDASKAFELFRTAIHQVQGASRTLIQYAGKEWDTNTEMKMLGRIWADYSTDQEQEDEISKKVEEAVILIENRCRPELEWTGQA